MAVINFTPEQFNANVKVTPEQAKGRIREEQNPVLHSGASACGYVELSAEALAPTIGAVPAEEVKAFYEANASRFIQKEERKASHILINAAKDAKDDVKAAKAKADEIFAQTKKDQKSFAELARKIPQDPGSANNGGDSWFFRLRTNGETV